MKKIVGSIFFQGKEEKIPTPQQNAVEQRLELANIPRFKNRTIKAVPTAHTSRHKRPARS